MNIYIDLHMHSNYSSDGEFSVSSLLEQCHNKGLKVIALSDHNSVKGIDEALKYAHHYNIKLIPAIEIDCIYKGIALHLLGYNIDYKNQDFKNIEEHMYKQELACSLKRLELTNFRNYEDFSLDINSHKVLIIGKNARGKTNLLDITTQKEKF